ncbi:hypothetical protein NAC36_000145 [Staphylococcus pseudintermedius]|uniref:hypothetical protein n=1 Tax=Staphylococcus pseudintermedius TaxID=283734 RepID=UPI000C1C57A8|nr:hypothetical protein [Staphylococcus pseudintermedius]EGQ1599641.1 hypothetical protein [Staphylococcus pseudintermedius]EGQ1614161.1 hypothetical protein [Staphylococcus pseudintermedius]EGQ1789066.1 hypothetical protein [Staphylococcus pseudintermedius]EGQ3233430.1 hypothetical protein [Staphylococcus pseudintermedius]EGQ3400008.1 hypothetical protein [Staphylococcus pseudintermedius]
MLLSIDQLEKFKNKIKGFETVTCATGVENLYITLPGEIIFRNGAYTLSVTLYHDKTLVHSFAEFEFSKLGEEVTEVHTVNELYRTLRKYAKYFMAGGEQTRAMLWLKQFFGDEK